MSTLERWRGRYEGTVTLGEEALSLADEHHLPLEKAMARASIWAARAHQDDTLEALDKLETVVADLRQQDAQFELLRVLGICAGASMLRSDQARAERFLDLAVAIGKDVGSLQPLAAEVHHSAPLTALVSTGSSRYEGLAGEIERLREVSPNSTESRQDNYNGLTPTTYDLRLWTLGQERVERDGRPIPTSAWQGAIPREMFYYLLFVGPARREQICLAFWPDATPEQARRRFHVAIHHARRALGEDAILFDNDLYMISPDVDVWSDAHELESLTLQARFLPPNDARTEDLWRSAAELYQGDFLPSLGAAWLIPWRETMQEGNLEALAGLGICTMARGDYRVALAHLEDALRVDPYREKLYRAMMTCYAKLGQRKEVRACFHRLENLLHKDLDAQPSAETITLAESLLN